LRLLLIEDDEMIQEVVSRGLEEEQGYEVDTAGDGPTGLRMALDEDYALIILDLMLPGLNGLRICEEIRNRRISTPILMLTARDAVGDRVKGLETGADDYLPKPFDFRELRARVHALLRRDKTNKARVLHIGPLVMDTGNHTVMCREEELVLTPREYSLLEALALSEGRVMTRDAIMYRVWGNYDATSNTVDVYIRMLRKKLEEAGLPKLINTVHGLGYMLKAPKRGEDQ